MDVPVDGIEFDGFDYEHESWKTAFSTVGSYLLVLLGMFFILFIIPYLLVTVLL